jgi:hypothetical protein
MIVIREAQVDAMAPNPEASKNGRGLVLKGRFTRLHTSEDGSLLFGECQGSGKEPYRCSCDFTHADQPTHRCSCPSRQFPCKHCLGLMYAYAMKKNFTVAEVPADLKEKREKLAAKKEKSADDTPSKPKTVNKTALAKKIAAQLEGIDILERLVHDLVRVGLGNMNAKLAGEMQAQAKQLGNAYLPGAQAALNAFTLLYSDESGTFAGNPEKVHSEALDQLARLHALIKQGRTYLKNRLDDPNLAPTTDSAIAAWLGHSWQLGELKAAGLVEENVELMQLAFHTFNNPAKQEIVETGLWMNLGNGRIRVTENFRPWKALAHVRGDDSFFDVATVQELCVYPGSMNPRIRWDAMTTRSRRAEDFAAIRSHAANDFAATIKEVKANLKGPLADKKPVVALNFMQIGKVGGEYVVADAKGERFVLTDTGAPGELPSLETLPLLFHEYLIGQTLIGRFVQDLETRQLRVKPLSIVTEAEVVRLTM